LHDSHFVYRIETLISKEVIDVSEITGGGDERVDPIRIVEGMAKPDSGRSMRIFGGNPKKDERGRFGIFKKEYMTFRDAGASQKDAAATAASNAGITSPAEASRAMRSAKNSGK